MNVSIKGAVLRVVFCCIWVIVMQDVTSAECPDWTLRQLEKRVARFQDRHSIEI
jgi:hypothetical protein